MKVSMRESSTKKQPHAKSPSRSARHAVWKGRLSFGLVGIPVALVPAVDAREHVGFHLLHRKDLAPIRYRKFCSKEQIEVPDDDVVRGFEVTKGKWAVVQKDELAAARKDAGAGTGDHALEISRSWGRVASTRSPSTSLTTSCRTREEQDPLPSSETRWRRRTASASAA